MSSKSNEPQESGSPLRVNVGEGLWRIYDRQVPALIACNLDRRRIFTISSTLNPSGLGEFKVKVDGSDAGTFQIGSSITVEGSRIELQRTKGDVPLSGKWAVSDPVPARRVPWIMEGVEISTRETLFTLGESTTVNVEFSVPNWNITPKLLTGRCGLFLDDQTICSPRKGSFLPETTVMVSAKKVEAIMSVVAGGFCPFRVVGHVDFPR